MKYLAASAVLYLWFMPPLFVYSVFSGIKKAAGGKDTKLEFVVGSISLFFMFYPIWFYVLNY